MRLASWSTGLGLVLSAAVAHAQPNAPPAPTPAPAEVSLTPSQVHLEGDANAPASTLPEAPPEAPPPPPHKKGFVLEGSMGALAFLGQFRHVAPTALRLRVVFGYEVARWLMLFADGEMAFTDTSIGQDPTAARAFPIFGVGAGARATIHLSESVAIFGEVGLGMMKADVPKNALANLGYRDAEGLAPSGAGRLGVEWYQVDRHLAVGLAFGIRDASGFKLVTKSDTPLMGDVSAAIRYTF